jgi:hypothetical protein
MTISHRVNTKKRTLWRFFGLVWVLSLWKRENSLTLKLIGYEFDKTKRRALPLFNE